MLLMQQVIELLNVFSLFNDTETRYGVLYMEYKKVKLSECCKSISDGDHLPPPKSQSGVPFITISNIDGDNQLNFNGTMFVPDSYYDSLSEEKKARIC